MKHELVIPMMSCEHCVKRIQNVLNQTPGILSSQIVLKTKKVTLEVDQTFNLDGLKKRLSDAHYPIQD